MHYFVLLLGPEAAEEPDAATQAAIMAEYQKFYTKAGAAIRAGDALLPSVTGVRITGDGDHPVVTEGPFAEGAEVAGGYFVIEAEDLDEALSLAADIPACRSGAVEVWPMVGWSPPTKTWAATGWRSCSSHRRRHARPTPRNGTAACASTRSSPRWPAITSSPGGLLSNYRPQRRPYVSATDR